MKANNVQEFELTTKDVIEALVQWVKGRTGAIGPGDLTGHLAVRDKKMDGYCTNYNLKEISGAHLKLTTPIPQKVDSDEEVGQDPDGWTTSL